MTRYPTLPTIKEAASLAVSWKRRARLSRVAGGGGEVSMRTGRRATRATKTPLPSPPDPPPPLIAMAAALPATIALPAAVPAASALPGHHHQQIEIQEATCHGAPAFLPLSPVPRTPWPIAQNTSICVVLRGPLPRNGSQRFSQA